MDATMRLAIDVRRRTVAAAPVVAGTPPRDVHSCSDLRTLLFKRS
jgi:hypothetical protein